MRRQRFGLQQQIVHEFGVKLTGWTRYCAIVHAVHVISDMVLASAQTSELQVSCPPLSRDVASTIFRAGKERVVYVSIFFDCVTFRVVIADHVQITEST